MLDTKWHGMVMAHPIAEAALTASLDLTALEVELRKIPDAEALPLIKAYYAEAINAHTGATLGKIGAKLLGADPDAAALQAVVVAEALRLRGTLEVGDASAMLSASGVAMGVSGGAAGSLILAEFDGLAAELGATIGLRMRIFGQLDMALSAEEAEEIFMNATAPVVE